MQGITSSASRFSVILALFVLLFSAGCGNDASREAASQKEKAPFIGAFLYKADDIYISSVAAAMESALHGKARLEIYSALDDQLTQLEQIDAALAEKPSALIVNLVDMEAGGVVVDKAKQAGIPVIFFNREPDLKSIARYGKASFVGTVPSEAGEMQGILIKRLWDRHPEYDRNKDGKFQYIMLQANANNPEALARTEYSVREARELGVALEQLGDTLLCNWDEGLAFESMRMALTVFADTVELVIANNDSMALGAIRALEEKGFNTGEDTSRFIPVIGVDATEQALKAIRRGVMSGTVKQDGVLMGETLAAMVLNAVDGKDFLDGVGLEWDESGVAVRLPYSMLEAD